ncbi:MAG: hypothetical protein AAF219_08780 [Myxococcota bacterium]
MTSAIRLPESESHLEAAKRKINREPGRVLDQLRAFRDWCDAQGLTPLAGAGFPLRPLYISRHHLHGLAESLFQIAAALRDEILRNVRDDPAPHPFLTDPLDFTRADLDSALRDASALRILRPDGFLFPDRFALTELNPANGGLLSLTYTETVLSYLHRFSTLSSLDTLSPLSALIALLRSVAGVESPRCALLSPTFDLGSVADWTQAVRDQVGFAPRLLREHGIAPVIVDETQLALQNGRATTEDGAAVDVIFNTTTGLGFFECPEPFNGSLAQWRGPKLGCTPIVEPLAVLALDKGALPTLTVTCGHHWSTSVEGFHVEIPDIGYPDELSMRALRTEKDKWVMKRSFRDKDTVTGISRGERQWDKLVRHAAEQGREYVFQRYVSMPVAEIPIAVDDSHIEWIEARVEISPFIIDGKYSGAMFRYAPDEEGIVMSPPPAGMGFGAVSAVD